MHPSGSLLSSRAFAPRGSERRSPAVPPGSVLALAQRRPEAVLTIGRWRIVHVPGMVSPQLLVRDAAVQPEASDRSLPAASPPCVSPPSVERHQARDSFPAAGDPAGLPDGVVWIDLAKSAGQQGVRQRRQPVPGPGVWLSGPAAQAVGPAHRGPVTLSALSWALLSQVFWIPLLAIDLQDRWVAYQRDVTPPGQPLPPSPIARASSFGLNELLAAARPLQQLTGQAHQLVGGALAQAGQGARSGVVVLLSRASSRSSWLDRPVAVSLETAAPGQASPAGLTTGLTSPGLLGRVFTRAQLLGGSIGLADLQEGAMAPLALAERALQRSNHDPLAPLPSLWREPMRQALLRLPGAPQQLSRARAVIVPSRVVSQPVEVPLALQSDGSVDVLEPPSDPTVLREIAGWSRQQVPPASGSLQPALLLLHPLPEVAPIPAEAFASAAPAPGPRAPDKPTSASAAGSGGASTSRSDDSRSTRSLLPVAAPSTTDH